MKQLIISCFLLAIFLAIDAQTEKAGILQNLEGNQQNDQKVGINATMISSSRLFKDKDDLSSVILIIPMDSTVSVLDSVDTYLRVVYQGNEGYINARHAKISRPEATTETEPKQENQTRQVTAEEKSPAGQNQFADRYSYLANKYDRSLADKIYSRKIWKGMTAEMVSDSWGSPRKINRIIDANNKITEEWIYKDVRLYIENSILIKWGRAK